MKSILLCGLLFLAVQAAYCGEFQTKCLSYNSMNSMNSVMNVTTDVVGNISNYTIIYTLYSTQECENPIYIIEQKFTSTYKKTLYDVFEKELYSETLQSVKMTMIDSSYLDSVGISCLPPIASNTTVSLLNHICVLGFMDTLYEYKADHKRSKMTIFSMYSDNIIYNNKNYDQIGNMSCMYHPGVISDNNNILIFIYSAVLIAFVIFVFSVCILRECMKPRVKPEDVTFV